MLKLDYWKQSVTAPLWQLLIWMTAVGVVTALAVHVLRAAVR